MRDVTRQMPTEFFVWSTKLDDPQLCFEEWMRVKDLERRFSSLVVAVQNYRSVDGSRGVFDCVELSKAGSVLDSLIQSA